MSTQAPAAPAAPVSPANVPTPPVEAKQIPKQSPAVSAAPTGQKAPAAAKTAPTGPKNGRIIPAVPLSSPAPSRAGNVSKTPAAPSTTAPTRNAVEDATQAATAAVAAAMAKLPPLGGQQQNGNNAVDNLTKKVNEMRTNDTIRAPRQPGIAGFGGRGAVRGRGGPRQEPRKVEVPKDDFDFESSNAKFNKQDLVKEAIAGSPVGEGSSNGPPEEAIPDISLPAASYNKSSSFFDDLSSESKDRAEGENTGRRPGGREWRGEEQKKNVETFGQGSVDNAYRGGYRGRGRGRGGMRGRGNYGNGQPSARGRGGYRGPREDAL